MAVEFDGVEYTYRDLADRSRRLARHLVASGVGPGVTVAVALRRSFDLLVAVYAVLEAGGAYVPLDPGHPAERLTYILEVAEPAVLLTETTAPVSGGDGIGCSTCRHSISGPCRQRRSPTPIACVRCARRTLPT